MSSPSRWGGESQLSQQTLSLPLTGCKGVQLALGTAPTLVQGGRTAGGLSEVARHWPEVTISPCIQDVSLTPNSTAY